MRRIRLDGERLSGLEHFAISKGAMRQSGLVYNVEIEAQEVGRNDLSDRKCIC